MNEKLPAFQSLLNIGFLKETLSGYFASFSLNFISKYPLQKILLLGSLLFRDSLQPILNKLFKPWKTNSTWVIYLEKKDPSQKQNAIFAS